MLFLGLCVAWPLLLYKMFDKNAKIFMTKAMFTLFVSAVLNAFVFKFKYRDLNVLFEITIDRGILQKTYPILSLLSFISFFAVAILLTFKFKKIKSESLYTCIILVIALAAISTKNAIKTKKQFEYTKQNIAKQEADNLNDDIEPIFHLSKTNKNVVVFFLDRACSAFFPIFQEEMPELAKKFNGFTYFPNTISFSDATLYGSPAMLGGYDYTPENISNRKDIPLQKKYDESALIMPLNFLENGFSVTVSGLPSTEFRGKNDFKGFENYPEIKTYGIFKKFIRRYQQEKNVTIEFDKICRKQISNFSILQVIFSGIRSSFHGITKNNDFEDVEAFINDFSALYFLCNLTDFSSNEKEFIFIGNDSPHYSVWLDTENYDEVSTKKINKSNISSLLNSTDDKTIMNYQAFVATLKQIGLFLDFLKANKCFNNTRIVITSDHGYRQNIKFAADKKQKFYNSTMLNFNPLLMVKDFYSDSAEIKVDNKFMTNADTILLASDEIISELKNPFLNKSLKQDKSNGVNVFYSYNKADDNSLIPIEKRYTLPLKDGYKIKNGFFDISGWEKIEH
ncbi:MAG: sulfatase-like hydrolase/transferase [Spirochaetales bacterium]|nr:sulfatase-like hydrolase/transferase [Spirochaetales bacterium]